MYYIPMMNAPDTSLSNRPTLHQSVIPMKTSAAHSFVLSEVEASQIALRRASHPCHTVTLSGQLARMSQMSHLTHFCDTRQIRKPCHTVTLSGQLAQCHRCHTFQLQKPVFRYDLL